MCRREKKRDWEWRLSTVKAIAQSMVNIKLLFVCMLMGWLFGIGVVKINILNFHACMLSQFMRSKAHDPVSVHS